MLIVGEVEAVGMQLRGCAPLSVQEGAMVRMLRWLPAALLLCPLPAALAQTAISAKAGLIQVADGDVFVNDAALHPKVAEFVSLNNKDLLRTGEGRTEV